MLLYLNDLVKVKLNPMGHKIYQQYWKNSYGLVAHSPYEPPKEDKNGWSTWQLWELMKIFGGENIGITKFEAFTPNALEFKIAQQEQKEDDATPTNDSFAPRRRHRQERGASLCTGQVTTILCILNRKFGTLPNAIAHQIQSLKSTQLDILTEELLDFQTIDDLQVWLRNF